MRKFTLMLAALILGFLGASAVTVTTSFGTRPSTITSNYKTVSTTDLPEGFGGCLASGSANEMDRWSWYSAAGEKGDAALYCANNGLGTVCYLAVPVKAGTVTFRLKAQSTSYVSSNNSGKVQVVKLTRTSTENAYSFSIGSQIANYSPLGQVPTEPAWSSNASSYVSYTLNVEEDGYIGIYPNYCYLYSVSNTYEAGPTTFNVTGTVKNEAGNVLAGATVTLAGQDAVTTGQDGKFSFTDVAGSNLALSVSANGYKNYSTTIAGGQDTDLAITMQEIESTLSVIVRDLAGSENLTNCTFSLYEAGSETPLQENVTAGSDGRYLFSVKGQLNTAGYTIKGGAKYYQPYNGPVLSNSTSTRDLSFQYGNAATGTLYLDPQRVSLTATVLDSENTYITDAVVTLTIADGNVKTATNNNDGTYTVSNLNAATMGTAEYAVDCAVSGKKPLASQQVSFDGQNATVTFIALDWQPTYYKGKVYDAIDDTPLEEATVTITQGTETIATATTGADGTYQIAIEGEITGDENYTITVDAQYYLPFSEEVALPVRESINTINAALDPEMYTFSCTVADPDGQAIEGARVRVGYSLLSLDENGKYSTEIWSGLCDGMEFRASAIAEGYNPATYDFEYTDGVKAIEYAFVLQPIEMSMTFTLQGPGAIAVTDATLVLKDAQGNKLPTVNNLDGTYTYSSTFLNLPEQPFTLAITADGYEPFSASDLAINVEDGDTTLEKTFTLTEEMYTLTLTVVSAADGQTINDATVTIKGGETDATAVADGQGNYTYTAGAVTSRGKAFTAEIEADGYDTATAPFNFDEGSVLLTVKMNATNGLNAIFGAGNVVSRSGKLFVNGQAAIYSIDGRLIRVVNTDESTEVEGLQPGLYIVAGQKVMVK